MSGLRKWLIVGAVLFVSVALDTSLAEARLFGGRGGRGLFGRRAGEGSSNVGAHMEYIPTAFSTDKKFYDNTLSLQDIAVIRAKWMAHFDELSHDIDSRHRNCSSWFGFGATGEGIGSSGDVNNYKSCPTCIVGNTVVADAHAVSKSGILYRVRLFIDK